MPCSSRARVDEAWERKRWLQNGRAPRCLTSVTVEGHCQPHHCRLHHHFQGAVTASSHHVVPSLLIQVKWPPQPSAQLGALDGCTQKMAEELIRASQSPSDSIDQV